MRLSVDALGRLAAAPGLIALLGACSLIGGQPPASTFAVDQDTAGPAADYPMVLGDPYRVDGVVFTPEDTLNFDQVGYAALDSDTSPGVTGAHKTLPLPSYVEVTSLESGRTILVRIERRGPMRLDRAVALSQDAVAQLGVAPGAPVRIRRVNPPEIERAELRAGKPAPVRMETPESLLAVLRRKLPEQGAASLARSEAAPSEIAARASAAPRPSASPSPAAAEPESFAEAFPATAKQPASYPLPPLATARPASPVTAVPVAKSATPAAPPAAPEATGGDFVIQAAAFANKSNAERAAGALGGFVSPAGRYWRVRTGPYSTRGQAEAALAKVRAAGYSDARVFTAG